ncbi:DUF948 domain-containing protein [Planomicrobium sp. CPCC 101110]|uniref:DUF948 domain-containing protein n=1 Tax=Planomicrobium sp. CPCC 101110 TaxID=2599619 RepID=UPI0011B68C51|nr:DUF948 domain-containing protein [Planomicrobium sp. CPCC 101110]TWT26064.1 DUF948 domain-containing protein [Planomicrobium sp. CPCC 101110]
MSPTIWLYIALAIFIVALVIAIIGVVIFVKGIKDPVKKMKGSADNLKGRMANLQLETTTLQHRANELKEDMAAKSERVSVMIDAAKGTKNSVLDLNSSVRMITSGVATGVSQDRRNVAQVNQLSDLTMGLLDLWKDLKYVKEDISVSTKEIMFDEQPQVEKIKLN